MKKGITSVLSIESDNMGTTEEGAPVWAALFPSSPAESDDPLDAFAVFGAFFTRAGLPESAHLEALHEQWRQNGA